MKKIVEGKTYNTSTADMICEYDPDAQYIDTADLKWHATELYKTTKGAYFLAGSGGASSLWGRDVERFTRASGSGIKVITEDEAKAAVERYADSEVYIQWFGEPEEA